MPIVEAGIVIASGAFVLDKLQEVAIDYGPEDSSKAFEVNAMTSSRGTVLPLTPQQRVNRALYLAGERTSSALDIGVRNPSKDCATIFYRLKDYNGGKDPTSPNPATYWRATQDGNLNITCDCIGGAAWCAGFDRYQPVRFAHIYSGWINTDSMIMDALGPARCFRKLERPEPGCFVVAATGSGPKKSIGHIGTVVDVPGDFDINGDWTDIGVVDVAARTGRANMRNSRGAAGWRERDGIFVVSTMK